MHILLTHLLLTQTNPHIIPSSPHGPTRAGFKAQGLQERGHGVQRLQAALTRGPRVRRGFGAEPAVFLTHGEVAVEFFIWLGKRMGNRRVFL